VGNETQNEYRILHLIVKYGGIGANLVTLAVLLVGMSGAVMTSNWWMIAIVLFATMFLYVIVHSYVELVRVIVDMLLPK
jgi:hypothetical protein